MAAAALLLFAEKPNAVHAAQCPLDFRIKCRYVGRCVIVVHLLLWRERGGCVRRFFCAYPVENGPKCLICEHLSVKLSACF